MYIDMSDSLHNLSLEQKIGQLFYIGVAGTTVDDATVALLNEIAPGGICLFARNIREAQQTRELLDELRDRTDAVPFLSLDQEGGLVDRLRRLIMPMPAANLFRDAVTVGRFAAIVAEAVRILGFNMDFAPVVDVITKERESVSNGMFSRAFGEDAEQAAEFAGSFLDALQSGGCLGCVKHFPGLGASSVDSHEELPQVNISDDELKTVDLVPYRRLLDRKLVHAVMVAHGAYPNTRLQERSSNGKLLPSSLSGNFITGLLRTELQFDGLVITDDLEMGAIIKNFGIGEGCVLAINAGADMLAICADPDRIIEGFRSVLEAVKTGRITEDRLDESLDRIETARSLLHEPLPFDTQRLAELSDSVSRLKDELK
jgi:beta-N-acetylhexosaminidase